MNTHMNAGECEIFEIRGAHGYGARWSLDADASETKMPQANSAQLRYPAFRGFLEPPMENGFAVGWKH